MSALLTGALIAMLILATIEIGLVAFAVTYLTLFGIDQGDG